MNTQLMFSAKTDDWRTPEDMLRELNKEFNFDFDPCPLDASFNGLTMDVLSGSCMFVNPPYSHSGSKGKKGKPGYTKGWVEKCHEEWQKGKTIVLLIPSRTDTAYFHDFILGKAEIRFVRGRLKFSGHHNPAPFPSMLAIFRGKND